MLNQHRSRKLSCSVVRWPQATRFTKVGGPLAAVLALAVAVGALHYAPELGEEAEDLDVVEAAAIGGQVDPLTADAPAASAIASKVPRHSRVLRHGAPTSAEQQKVAQFIAERYRLAFDQTQELVGHAYRIARDAKLDPWLVLAVISVESSFNPKAQSHQGAQGLMQVLTRVHADKFAPFGGAAAAFDPLANMRVGTQILKEYLARAGGSVEDALKSYVGAALLPHDGGYGAKVLFERERIAAAATGRAQPARPRMVVARADSMPLPRNESEGRAQAERETPALRRTGADEAAEASPGPADLMLRPWVEVDAAAGGDAPAALPLSGSSNGIRDI